MKPFERQMSFPMFDRDKLRLRPLAERQHDMTLAEVLPLDAPDEPFDDPQRLTFISPPRHKDTKFYRGLGIAPASAQGLGPEVILGVLGAFEPLW